MQRKSKGNTSKNNVFNSKYTKIGDQVVITKSPWPKVIFSLLLTVAIIFFFYKVHPGFPTPLLYLKKLKGFFRFFSNLNWCE